jgi:small GTP-binding protein
MSNKFTEDHDVTVGVDFGSYMIRVEGVLYKLQIWDTAGQESFRSITKIFYRSADAVILGYSITQRDSFEHLADWLREIKSQCDPEVLVFLVGNKSDMEDERCVSVERAR